MKKGVQCFTIREYMKDREQYESSLRKLKAIGYECIQSGTPQFMTNSEVKEFLDDIGLETTTAYSDFEKMSIDPETLKAAISQAKTYGTDLIGIGTLPPKYRESKSGYKEFTAELNRVATEVYKEGCKIIYHPHALEFFSFGQGEHGMDIMFNESDPSCVYFSLDTHWMAAGGVNPTDWIYKSKGRMPLIHFKDYAIVGGATKIEMVCKQFAEVGEGNLNWESIVKACHETGIEYAVVEQDICKGNPFDSLQISYDNMIKLNV